MGIGRREQTRRQGGLLATHVFIKGGSYEKSDYIFESSLETFQSSILETNAKPLKFFCRPNSSPQARRQPLPLI